MILVAIQTAVNDRSSCANQEGGDTAPRAQRSMSLLCFYYYTDAVMITGWCYCLSNAMITRWRYYINAVMITRWQQRFDDSTLSEAMLTRWHYCISVEMVTGWVHWIVNPSSPTAKNFGLQEEKTNISKPHGKTTQNNIKKTGWCTTKRDTWTERERKRECSTL